MAVVYLIKGLYNDSLFLLLFYMAIKNILGAFHGNHLFQTKIQDPEFDKRFLCQFCH